MTQFCSEMTAREKFKDFLKTTFPQEYLCTQIHMQIDFIDETFTNMESASSRSLDQVTVCIASSFLSLP